jgi:PIN domain nuclease of toxin-antitoxin system
MTRPILLDTCAIVWINQNEPLRGDAERILAEADQVAGGVVVSPISAWEIGVLMARGRLAASLNPEAWFDALLEAGAALAAMPPEVLMASSFLPDCALRDPADRILAATARASNYRLMTRDQPLLDYASTGHLKAVGC